MNMHVAPETMADTSYSDALCSTMAWLGQQDRTIFVGQGVSCAGTTMTDTLKNVPREKLLEFPVAEELQMGFCIGLALEGYTPICVFPRWNFVLRAADQIVNHLDRLPAMSRGEFNPRVIIRVAAPIVAPFYPGPQHDDDFQRAFAEMLRHVRVVNVTTGGGIKREYQIAFKAPHPTIIVEHTALYRAIPSGVRG